MTDYVTIHSIAQSITNSAYLLSWGVPDETGFHDRCMRDAFKRLANEFGFDLVPQVLQPETPEHASTIKAELEQLSIALQEAFT
jgi:hypothetical protein